MPSSQRVRGISLLPTLPDGSHGAAVWWIVGVVSIIASVSVIVIPWQLLRANIALERQAMDTLESRRAAVRQAPLDSAVHPDAIVASAVRLRELLAVHRSWDRFFALLESRTLPDVEYIGFTGDVSGNVVLHATAPSVDTAAAQLQTFTETPNVSAATVAGISETESEVRFDVTLRLDPIVFAFGK